jgi:predicted XRE-type DNA-binding protein
MPKLSIAERREVALRVRALLKKQGLTQMQLSTHLKVDQPLISRLLAGKIRRITPRIRRVLQYADIQIQPDRLPQDAAAAVKAYIAGGGEVALLCDALDLLLRAGVRPNPSSSD